MAYGVALPSCILPRVALLGSLALEAQSFSNAVPLYDGPPTPTMYSEVSVRGVAFQSGFMAVWNWRGELRLVQLDSSRIVQRQTTVPVPYSGVHFLTASAGNEGPLAAYATVVDNATNDTTCYPGQLASKTN